MLHADRYEESLTEIHHQLDTLSSKMRSIAEGNQILDGRRFSNDETNSTPSSLTLVSDQPHDRDHLQAHDQRDYQGESSFQSQSRYMTDTLTQVVSSVHDRVTDGRASIVQSLVQDAHAPSHSEKELNWSLISSSISHHPDLARLALPPMDAVLRMLAFVKTSPQRYFNYPYADQEDFAALCQKVYFPTQPYTIFAWVNVNCGLFYLFRDLETSQYDKLHLTKSQVADIVATSTRNVDQATISFKLCMDPSLEAATALVTIGAINMERANGPMAWKFISAAARMSIDLGYHRLPLGYGDEERAKQRKLFWYIYSMDKSSAFNFGRSSTIQDYDVTTERPLLDQEFKHKSGQVFHAYIDFSIIQYDIYIQLFSPKAQQEATSARTRKAHALASRLSEIKDKFSQMLDQNDVVYRGTEICLLSALTLVYRVLPPHDSSSPNLSSANLSDSIERYSIHSLPHSPIQFHSLCVRTGRTALNSLVHGWTKISEDQDEDAAKTFVNWALHHVPFMPFIAVLGNQIVTEDKEDLQLLKRVTSIVETAAETNKALHKLHRAFSQLLKIAELLSNASRESHRGDDQTQGTATLPEQQRPSNVRDIQNTLTSSSSDQLPDDTDATGPTLISEQMGPNLTNWRDTDLDLTNQDWDSIFNEFDLGLGAGSARDLMPWFEQNINSFNTY